MFLLRPKYFIFYLITGVLLLQCRHDNRAHDPYYDDVSIITPTSNVQSISPVSSTSILFASVTRIATCGNFIVLMGKKIGADKDYWIHIADTNSDSLVFISAIPVGGATHEMESIYQLIPRNNGNIGLYDWRKSILKTFMLDSIYYNPDINHEPIATITFDKRRLRNIVSFDDVSYVANSIETTPMNRFYYFDSIGKFLKGGSSYPSLPAQLDSIGWPEAYYCSTCYSSLHNILVLANQSTDLIELYSYSHDELSLYKKLYGPDRFKSYFESSYEGSAHSIYPIADLTRDAYFSINCTDDMFYVLYSGHLVESRSATSALSTGSFSRLLVFNYDGWLISEYRLEQPVIGVIAIDTERNTLWGISHNNDQALVMYQL